MQWYCVSMPVWWVDSAGTCNGTRAIGRRHLSNQVKDRHVGRVCPMAMMMLMLMQAVTVGDEKLTSQISGKAAAVVLAHAMVLCALLKSRGSSSRRRLGIGPCLAAASSLFSSLPENSELHGLQ